MPTVRRKEQKNISAGSDAASSNGGSYFWCLLSFLFGVAVTSMSYQQNNMMNMTETTTKTDTTATATTTSTSTSTTAVGSTHAGEHRALTGSTTTKIVTTKDFEQIGINAGTDKVVGAKHLPNCLATGACVHKDYERERCRPWGHWYHTLYHQWISKYALPTAEPFQFLEIGFYQGKGYETYDQFFSEAPKAELHSMEISCIEEGPRAEGKWPKEWGNSASKSPRYQQLLDTDRLHCGDASDLEFLDRIWKTKMHRPGAPPLRIVVDDASHLSSHIVASVFFWFPRIEPGGLLVVEDIQPIIEANRFRTQFLPQIMSDLHYCGDPNQNKDEACFPQLWPLLQSIHCEMHICVFERNSEPAKPDLSLEESKVPDNALDLSKCYSFAHTFGM